MPRLTHDPHVWTGGVLQEENLETAAVVGWILDIAVFFIDTGAIGSSRIWKRNSLAAEFRW